MSVDGPYRGFMLTMSNSQNNALMLIEGDSEDRITFDEWPEHEVFLSTITIAMVATNKTPSQVAMFKASKQDLRDIRNWIDHLLADR